MVSVDKNGTARVTEKIGFYVDNQLHDGWWVVLTNAELRECIVKRDPSKLVTSFVTDTRLLFLDAEDDVDVSSWDMSRVRHTGGMFRNAKKFTGKGIGVWDVGRVIQAMGMFKDAVCFDEDLSSWNVSQVACARNMFAGATAFKGKGVGSWDTSEMSETSFMFMGLPNFD